MTDTTDPRPPYGRALRWVRTLMDDVDPAQLRWPTPCPEFDLRALLGHLVGTAERSLATAEGRPTRSIPHVVSDVPDLRIPVRYGELSQLIEQAWTSERLVSDVHAPWGTVNGRDAVWGFAAETFAHGWDIAVATDQDPEADPHAVDAVLARAGWLVPDSTARVPYASTVDPRPDAGPTERLANWLGHRWP